MTKEEAIGHLRVIITYAENDGYTELAIEALKMAIKSLEQEYILDKIRVEVEQLKLHKAEFLTSDNRVCIDSQEVLDIINKYKAESEDKE